MEEVGSSSTNILQRVQGELCIGYTMSHMFKRELSRMSNGHYKKSLLEELWTLAIILTFFSFAGLVIWGSYGIDYYIENWTGMTLITFLFPLLAYIFLKISLVMRWCLYWVLVTTVLLFVLQTTNKLDQKFKSWIFFGFVIIESLTVIIYLWTRWIFPGLVLKVSKYDPNRFWKIVKVKEGQFTCRKWFRINKTKRFSYVGQVNKRNEPHGFGKWISEWKHGEILTGNWENGIPIGPFKSREFGSGYGFSNIRVAFVSTDMGSFEETTTLRSPYLRYGCVSVECSSSGKFFTELPNISTIVDPFEYGLKDPIKLKTVLEKTLHYNDICEAKENLSNPTEVVVRSTSTGFDIPGYVPTSAESLAKLVFRHRFPTKSQDVITRVDSFDSIRSIPDQSISFNIEGWRPIKSKKEAIVFITGFNCSLESAIESFGQMITLGSLSSRIVPFVYKWPGGKLYNYWKAIEITNNYDTISDLIHFLKELTGQGFENIHLLSHSMGARLVTNSLSRFQEVFHHADSHSINRQYTNETDETSLKSHLISMTFLNPETPLEDFRQIHYDHLKKFCKLITMYGSNNDIALLASEYIFSRRQNIGCHVHDMVLNPNSDLESLDLEYMDIDVIDTTELDINIHAVRHMYFNLNKFVIDDVFDLVSTRARAKAREHRVLNIGGNVFGFLAAPSYLVK